jgi:8-oxo-dGTP diphosphatase
MHIKIPKQIVAVAGLVENSQNEILLVRHPRRGWEIAGGQVEEGENLINALKREVKEEAGVDISVGELAGIYTKYSSPALLILGFLCEYIEGDLRPSSESPEVSWVPKGDVLERISHPAIHDRIQDMLKYNGKIMYRVYSTDPYVIHDEMYLA